MLEFINRLAHGVVAVPVLSACAGDGLARVAAGTDGNPGYLRAAQRLLVALDVLRCRDGGLVPGPRAGWVDRIPARLAANLPPESLIADVADQWGGGLDPLLAELCDGAVLVPLLLSLADAGWRDTALAGRPLPLAQAGEPLRALFVARGWADGDGRCTDLGRGLLDRIPTTLALAAYRPMLTAVPDLLFGDCRAIFRRDASGRERHLDRRLNVVGSGFQHGRFFDDLEDVVHSVFGGTDFAAQPAFVADMGCGDGTLLERIWRLVADRTPRGAVLDAHPLVMVGLDYNQAALDETERRLGAAGVPFRLLHGDIGDPAAVARDLRGAGIDPDHVLHVRSFLDHDRPFKPPVDTAAAAGRAAHRLESVHVAADGSALAPEDAVQSLVEHMAGWAALCGRHGLVMLEVHALPAAVAGRYLDQAESLHFDAYHAFSHQHLVRADVHLLAMAEAGLLPEPGFSRRTPRTLPYARITLDRLRPQPFRVRPVRPADLEALVALDAAVWPEPLRTPPDRLARRIAEAPHWHLVAEMDGRVVGALYTQPVASLDVLRSARHDTLDALRQEDGAVAQLLGLAVHPAVQDAALGDRLLSFGLEWLARKPGLTAVAGLTRCRDWDGVGMLADYVARTGPDGLCADPIPRFHQAHGARIDGVVAGYRAEDPAGGILVIYDFDRAPPEAVAGTAAPVDALAAVLAATTQILGPRRADRLAPDLALRDMGLDSLDLMELRILLAARFGRTLDAGIFFRHPSPAAVARALAGEDAPAPARPVAASGAAPAPSDPGRPIRVAIPIAIVGIGCRLPGARGRDAFWDLLRHGRDAISEVPPFRWDADALTAETPATPGRINSRRGGFVADLDRFDAALFRIGRREALQMDPQQRLVLETAWEAFEDAGLDLTRLGGSATGVFLGIASQDFAWNALRQTRAEEIGIQFNLGLTPSVAAGRLSYLFDLRGPAVAVDTACSSSLMAVHLACQSLASGETDVALAAGVNALLAPENGIAFSQVKMLSPRGACHSFDASADGFVRGEGCGAVVLKRLDRALADGDPIVAVLRGTAVNQDGASNGLTAPSQPAQAALIRQCLERAGVAPAAVTLLEAHGTATVLGDAVEAGALAEVFGGRPDALLLGSVKTNIGHLEAAAGIAGLIKAALAVHHGVVPPSLNFRTPNPDARLDAIPAEVPVTPRPWPEGRPRLAGVSSFGYMGTNVHALVEAPPERPAGQGHAVQLYPVSARDEAGLAAAVSAHAAALPDSPWPGVARTAGAGRASFAWRTAVVAESAAEAADLLARADRVRAEKPPRIAFLFTGQGAAYPGMAATLFAEDPIFRATVERCGAAAGLDLSAVFSGGVAERPSLAQPALYALQAGLSAVLAAWGVRPAAVTGHSLGEYAAAQAAGVFTLEDGARLVAARGRLIEALPEGGAMVALHASVAEVEPALCGGAVIAVHNAPDRVVVAGPEADVARVVAALGGVRATPLEVTHAFHSPLMAPAAEGLRAVAAGVPMAAPRLPLIANEHGRLLDTAPDADHWVGNLVRPVRFADGMRALAALECDVLVEIGPRPVLLGLAEANGLPGERLSALDPARGDWRTLLDTLGRLYLRGTALDWPDSAGIVKARVPGTALADQRFAIPGAPAVSEHPVLGRALDLAFGLHGWQADGFSGDFPPERLCAMLEAAGGRAPRVLGAMPPGRVAVQTVRQGDRVRLAVRTPEGAWQDVGEAEA